MEKMGTISATLFISAVKGDVGVANDPEPSLSLRVMGLEAR